MRALVTPADSRLDAQLGWVERRVWLDHPLPIMNWDGLLVGLADSVYIQAPNTGPGFSSYYTVSAAKTTGTISTGRSWHVSASSMAEAMKFLGYELLEVSEEQLYQELSQRPLK